ncbi:hypothetical protein [Dyadobacter sp.]|uniref:hypothetical protein n=1 Tax=Dyadobacter sp. TaxID=1914288 RepID=UPI003F706E81
MKLLNVVRERGNITHWLLTGIIYLASFKAPNIYEFALDYYVPRYIQIVQMASLPLIAIMLAVALLVRKGAMAEDRSFTNFAVLFFYLFHIVLIITGYVYNSNLQDLIFRFIFLSLLSLFFYAAVSKMAFYTQHGRSLVKSVFWGSFLFILTNLVLYLGSIGNVMWKGRLFGVTSHPNFVGMCGSICCTLAFCLLYLEKKTASKLLYGAAFIAGCWVCTLSDSRTSMISAALSISAFIIYSIRNIALRSVSISVLLLISLLLIGMLSVDTVNYEGRGNTREETWASLYDEATNLPIFGKGRAGATTNGYLFAIVAAGLFGSMFFFIGLSYTLAVLFRPQRNPQKIEATNIYKSLLVLILTGSMFEGFLLDAVGMPVFIFWMLLAKVDSIKSYRYNSLAV